MQIYIDSDEHPDWTGATQVIYDLSTNKAIDPKELIGKKLIKTETKFGQVVLTFE